MINFHELTIRRIIVHNIVAKQTGQEHATADLDQRLLQLDDDVNNMLKERLAKSAEKTAKAFILEIGDYGPGSFFEICHKMKEMTDAQFIEASQDLAYLLASVQKRNTIPGGYLIVVEAFDKAGRNAYIAIKAELHEALRYEWTSDTSAIRLLDDVFLSPSQKLFKIGMIFERENELLDYPNDQFGCFLYDEQFRVDSSPAEFFYKDFLGFTTDTNPKIQSKRFYDATSNFIKSNFDTVDNKTNMLQALKHEFASNEEDEAVSPLDFANSYFDNNELQEHYAAEVAPYLPPRITKDHSLIKSKINKKRLIFPNNIVIMGPNRTFDFSVEEIKSKEQLEGLDFTEGSFTLLKITGKPTESE